MKKRGQIDPVSSISVGTNEVIDGLPKKRGKGIFIILLIVIIIVIILISLFLFFNKGNSLCGNTSNDNDLAKCYADLVIKNNDSSFCEKIPKKDLILNCYQIVAFNLSDWNYCDFIKNDTGQSNCVYTVSFSTKPPERELCNKVRGIEEKGSCLRQLANTQKNISICDEIIGNTQKQFCFNNLNSTNTNTNPGDTIFDCSEIFDNCNSQWLKDNSMIPENLNKITAKCNEICSKLSMKSGGFGKKDDSTIITCNCS